MSPFNKVPMEMKKRLASLALLLLLLVSASAGMPLRSGERGCNMTMEGMDCCKAALMHSETPEVAAARLCCSLNCSQAGAMTPSSTVRLAPQTVIALHPAGAGMASPALGLQPLLRQSHSPPQKSQPIYIRHLALLI